MKRLISVFTLCAASAFAQGTDYREATLVNFKTVETGSTCSSSGSVSGQVDDSGDVTGRTSGNSSCSANMTRYYTLRSGEHTYTLRYDMTAKKKAAVVASLGYARFFMKSSVLNKRLPGTKVLLRSDEKGAAWVKIGNRESRYEIVEAR